MQRHRNDEIGFVQQNTAAATQPAPEAGSQIQAVAVLQREDRTAAVLVIAHDGARPVECWRPRMATGTERRAAGIELERQAATVTHGAIEEADLLPAIRAKGARLGNLAAAGNAERRKQEIECRPPGAPQPALQSPAHVV